MDECIDHYLEKYDIVLENLTYKSKEMIEGSLRLFNAKQKFGHILYAIDKKTKNLHINSIYVPNVPKTKNKPNIPVKFVKILLAYLLTTYSRHIETSTLSAKPGTYRKGREFCLLCIYQELGFEPYELKAKQKIENYLKKCNIQSNRLDACILCICQKETDKLEKIDLSLLYVDMAASLPKLKRVVKELSDEIDC